MDEKGYVNYNQEIKTKNWDKKTQNSGSKIRKKHEAQ